MSTSPEQLHEMLTYCMDFARTMLTKAGDFYPFGATLSSDGKVGAFAGYNGEEHPVPQEIYKLLVEAFAAGAADGSYVGTALAANVNIPAEYSPVFPDGLRVHLESRGYSRFIYVPYRIVRQGFLIKKSSVEYGEPFSVETKAISFSIEADA